MTRSRSSSHGARSAELILAGRKREQALLSQRLEVVLAGAGSLALITGEAGIGKTALVQHLAAEAASRDVLILIGHCYDLSATVPYQPWIEALNSRLHELAPPSLSSDLRDDLSHRSQQQLLDNVYEFLRAASKSRPILIVLEDMHWSDSASLELLRFVSRRLAGLRVLIVVTYRDSDLNASQSLYRFIPRIVREADLSPERINLRGLGAAAIREVVAHRLQLPEHEETRLLRYLQHRSDGNPFFIHEILRSLEEQQVLESTEYGWKLHSLQHVPVPSLIRQIIEERLARVGAETRDLLQVAAVIGQNVPVELWHTVSSVSEDYLVEIVEQPIKMQLLEDMPDNAQLRFSHALVRETLYESLGVPRRRIWHRRVAEAMAASGDSSENIAFHFERAGDMRAINWYIEAGERARRIAWLTATDHFETALRLMDRFGSEPRERGWLQLRLGLLYRFADPQNSLQHLDHALQQAVQADDSVLAACALCSHGAERRILGDVRGGIAEEQAGLTALDTLHPQALEQFQRLVRTGFWAAGLNPYANLVGILADVGSFDSARQLADRLISEADDSTVFEIGPLVHYGLGAAAAAAGDPHAARTAFSQARDGFRAVYDQVLVGSVALWELLWVALPYHADDPGMRQDLAREAEDAYSRAAGAQGGWSPRIAWLPGLVLEGEWDEAKRLAEASHGATKAWPRYEFTQTVLALIAREGGDPGKAWECITEVFPEGPATEPGGMYFLPVLDLLRLAVNLALDAKDIQVAQRWLEAYDRWLDWSGAVLGRAESHCLRAAHLRVQGNTAEARVHAEQALGIASQPRQPLALIETHRMLGELLTREGRWIDAERNILTAEQIAIVCQTPLAVAQTKLALAQLRAVQRRRGEARELLTDARGICMSIGAKRLLGKADSLLTQRDHSPIASAYPAGISPREHEVLTLVVTGLTNAEIADRLFLSRRTVEQHLRSVYKKLGVSSRVAATRYAIEHHLI